MTTDRYWRDAARESIRGASDTFSMGNRADAGLPLIDTYMQAAQVGVTAAIAEALLDLAESQHRSVDLSERLYGRLYGMSQAGTLPDDLDDLDGAADEPERADEPEDDDEDDDEDDEPDERKPGEPRSLVGLLGDSLIDAVNRADFWEGVAEGAESAAADLRDQVTALTAEVADLQRQLDAIRQRHAELIAERSEWRETRTRIADENAGLRDEIVRMKRETRDEDI